MNKEGQTYMVTWVTHNSRISERMVDLGVCMGPRVWIAYNSEIKIACSIARIVKNDGLRILAFNICGDHVHMVIVCSARKLSNIVQKLKSISSREHNVAMGVTKVRMERYGTPTTRDHDPLSSNHPSENPSPMPKKGKAQNHLWAQKFHQKAIRDEYYLHNAIHYVKYNRQKHKLPENKQLQTIIDGMICTEEEAFL